MYYHQVGFRNSSLRYCNVVIVIRHEVEADHVMSLGECLDLRVECYGVRRAIVYTRATVR